MFKWEIFMFRKKYLKKELNVIIWLYLKLKVTFKKIEEILLKEKFFWLFI
jgi:hypothetical protein